MLLLFVLVALKYLSAHFSDSNGKTRIRRKLRHHGNDAVPNVVDLEVEHEIEGALLGCRVP